MAVEDGEALQDRMISCCPAEWHLVMWALILLATQHSYTQKKSSLVATAEVGSGGILARTLS